MDSGHLIFDSSSSSRSGHMLILGGGNSIFRGPRSVLGMEESTNKRRPFFTSPEELLDEEYYDEQLPEKKRRLTPEQVHLLERSFEAENKLEPERKTELAKTLGLQPRQVAVWFQNRRARWKTKQLERDFDRLKAAYDSLLADHDSIVKDNDCLRSQVATLSEKLQAKELGAVVVSQREMMKSLSSGSGGSSVVDGNIGEGPHHLAAVDVSSDESYFHQDSCCFQGNYIDIGAPIAGGGGGGVRSSEEEEDGSDDGCNYNIPVGGMFRDSNQASNDDNWWGVWNP